METILTEFSAAVNWMQNQLAFFLSNHKEMKMQLFKLLEHNRKLLAELKSNAQGNFMESSSDIAVKQLQQQLKEALDSKAAVMDMWQKAVKELELKNQQKYESMREDTVDERIAAVNSHYAKGLNILSQELSEARTQMNDAKDEVKHLTEELQHSKDSLSKFQVSLQEAENLASNLKFEIKNVNGLLITAKTELAEKNEAIKVHIKENDDLLKKNSKLDSLNKELLEKLSVIENEKKVTQKHANESLVIAQEAILQKKEILYKEQIASKFIQNLKSSVDQEVEHATLKYKNEIKNIQKQNSEKIQALMQEIKYLQRENSEKQSSFEKLQRQMHATEEKLNTMCGDNTQFIAISLYNDICRRLTLTEKSRDEAAYKALSLETIMKDSKLSLEREKEFFKSESKTWKEQFLKLQSDLNKVMGERVNLTDLVMRLKKKCSLLAKDIEVMKNQHGKEVSCLSHAISQKEDLFSQQLILTEEHFKKLISEQHKLLDAQSDNTKKWKDAVEELTLSSELKMKEMYQDILTLQNQNLELERQLHEHRKNSTSKSMPLSLV